MLGGDRAAELRLVVAHQIGGADGALGVECTLTPSGDDPYPLIRWLIHNVHPFATPTAGCLASPAGRPYP